MKKVLLFVIPLLAMMSSCIKDEMVECPSCKDKVRFWLQVREEGVQYVTRATDERTVRDVNLFLYDPRGVLPDRHFYVESGTVECSVLPGRYEAYAVVNIHRDMGAKTRERLLEAKISAAQSYETLPMSGHATLTVEDRMSDPVLTVRRAVAKAVCNIAIESSVVYTLKLQSVQLVNAAASTKLFAEEEAGGMFVVEQPLQMSSSEGRKATRTFYMFENCRGDVPSITTQQQKCAANAPRGATYVRIKARKDGLEMTYDVYLGENNTSNFDVRRNTVQTLDIRIKGKNEVDARIHSFEVKISDNMPNAEFHSTKNYCTYETGKKLSIIVTNREKADDLSAKIRLVTGVSGALQIDGRNVVSDLSFTLDDPSGIYEFPIVYKPGNVFTADNHRLVFEVTVRSTNGYSYTKTISHDFYNLLTVYTFWTGQDRTAGRLEDFIAESYIQSYQYNYTRTLLLSLDDGPTMPVVPNDGFAFKGWYSDRNLAECISVANPYRHPMTSFNDTLYTEFVKEWVYIYTKLDEVQLTSNTGYTINTAKQAFVVLPGSRCTISGKTELPVITWWNNPDNVSPRRIVATGNSYTFTATTNLTLIPDCRMSSKEELSTKRTPTSTD